MELNDFSSVFELLCGYNLVNAINSNSELLKVLDFTSPIKDSITTFKAELQNRTTELINDLRSSDEEDPKYPHIDLNLEQLYNIKSKAKILETKNISHEQNVNNLYLTSGIFCFLILVLSPFITSYNKLNSIALLTAFSIVLYALFILCDLPPKNSLSRKITIIVLSIFALFVISSGTFGYSFFERNDRLFLVFLSPLILLIIFYLIRKWILERKIYKSMFIFLFLFPLFFPNTNFFYSFFYQIDNSCIDSSIGFLIVTLVIVALFPLIWDILVSNYIVKKLKKLKKSIEEEYKKYKIAKEMTEGGIGANPGSTSPISGI